MLVTTTTTAAEEIKVKSLTVTIKMEKPKTHNKSTERNNETVVFNNWYYYTVYEVYCIYIL